MSTVPPVWRYGVTSAFKGIYVIRYFLFAGGLSIGAGMLERWIFGTVPPVAGLLAGFFVGLLAFRGQLQPLRWPSLYLSRENLYLVQRKQAVTLPWNAIQSVAAAGPLVVLELKQPMTAPTGGVADQIQLEAKKRGTGAEPLASALRAPLSDPASRAALPPDAFIREKLALPA